MALVSALQTARQLLKQPCAAWQPCPFAVMELITDCTHFGLQAGKQAGVSLFRLQLLWQPTSSIVR